MIKIKPLSSKRAKYGTRSDKPPTQATSESTTPLEDNITTPIIRRHTNGPIPLKKTRRSRDDLDKPYTCTHNKERDDRSPILRIHKARSTHNEATSTSTGHNVHDTEEDHKCNPYTTQYIPKEYGVRRIRTMSPKSCRRRHQGVNHKSTKGAQPHHTCTE